MYSLLIELFNEKDNCHLEVFNENNLTVEDCVKQALKWRIRPYQKMIKKVYIYIEPLSKDESNNRSSLSNGSSGYANLTTQSTFSVNPQIFKGDDDVDFQATIQKKISFACYGKFVSFLKSYCIKNDTGSFRIVFNVEDTNVNTFFDQLVTYQKKMKKKILSYNIGVNELTDENKLVCETIIGLGAFGVVYKSPMPYLRNGFSKKYVDTCAIKVIPLLTISNITSIYREIYILNLMSLYEKMTPYVVNYYASFVDDEYLYIVMEYLQGPSLNHFVTTNSEKYSQESSKNKKEHINEIISISNHLSKGLQHIHDIGVVHRDLKPGNIMFDGKNNFKIVDFGFAALMPKSNVEEILKWDNKVVGTYRFSPPEVLSFSENINWTTADYWSMGTVIYYVVSGKQFLDRSSKDRNEMLNILHKRIDTTKPLKIQFFNIFGGGEQSINLKGKTKSASAPAACNNNIMTLIKNKGTCENIHVNKSKEQLENLIRGLLEYLPENRKIKIIN